MVVVCTQDDFCVNHPHLVGMDTANNPTHSRPPQCKISSSYCNASDSRAGQEPKPPLGVATVISNEAQLESRNGPVAIGRPRGWVHLPAQSELRSRTVQVSSSNQDVQVERKARAVKRYKLVGCEIVNKVARVNSASRRSTEYILEPSTRAGELVSLLGGRRFSSVGC